MQHSAPFWFSLTAGEVAKQLNQIVDLGLIDEVMAKIASRSRKASAEAEVTKDRLEAAESNTKELSFVTPLSEELEDIENRQEELLVQKALYVRLTADVSEGTRYRDRQQTTRGAILDGSTAIKLGLEGIEVRTRSDSLYRLMEKIREEQQYTSQEVPDIDSLSELRDNWLKIRKTETTSVELVQHIGAIGKKIRTIYNRLEETKKQFLEEVGEICPICNRPMKW